MGVLAPTEVERSLFWTASNVTGHLEQEHAKDIARLTGPMHVPPALSFPTKLRAFQDFVTVYKVSGWCCLLNSRVMMHLWLQKDPPSAATHRFHIALPEDLPAPGCNRR